jgi:hypothetical protein
MVHDYRRFYSVSSEGLHGIETHSWREEVRARASEHGLDQDANRAAHRNRPDTPDGR